MADDAATASFRLRASRAAPPHRASEAERRETYTAALAQFEELTTAASSASPASRPLPLFYALSQAGRAIAAARAPQRWQLRGHGLTASRLDGDALSVTVRRAAGRSTSPDTVDSFSGVGAATGSELFTEGTSLGELWMSLPELRGLLPPEIAGRWRSPLLLVPDGDALTDQDRIHVRVIGYDGAAEELIDEVEHAYPTAAGMQLPPGPRPLIVHRHDVHVCFEAMSPGFDGQFATLNAVAPGTNGFARRWLRPAVGDAVLSPLMTWWALLFGLSMLARYEPASWTRALALDSSLVAAPLARCMRIAVEQIPELVLAALLDP